MELFGVRLRLHPTFIWLLLIFFLIGGVGSLAWILLVFAFVVLHELSHSLVAKAHGIVVQDITLLPIGGVARLRAMPEDSRTEFLVSVAGPVFNFAVAGAAVALLWLLGPLAGKWAVELLEMIVVINLVLGVFNLLPAFPMDGGRLLRAYLATKHGYLAATHTAARVGRWIAGALAVISIVTLLSPSMHWNPWLLVIAVFIYVSGKQEELAVAARHAARGFWQLFGYGEPTYRDRPGGFEVPPYADDGAERHGRDVIDVKGEVRPDPDQSAADAFRKLGDEGDAHLKD